MSYALHMDLQGMAEVQAQLQACRHGIVERVHACIID